MSERRGHDGGAFRFTVVNVMDVPLRGVLLRLRLQEGVPSLRELGPGRRLLLRSPAGEEREVRVLDFSVTGGRATQSRLERMRELDVIVARDDAWSDGRPIRIGWSVVGAAAERRTGRAA